MLSSNKTAILVVFATSLNQARFAAEVIKQAGFSEKEKVLLLADPTMYNEVPNRKYKQYACEYSEIYTKILYLNELLGYTNLNQCKDLTLIGGVLENAGVRLSRVGHLLIGLLSTSLYLSITKVFYKADISVYSDGMMSFGPLRGDVYKDNLHKRIKDIFYEDLCEGIDPNYLPELCKSPVRVRFDLCCVESRTKSLLIALQSLSYSKIMSEVEEYNFYSNYIQQIKRVFHGYKVYVLPHPNNSSELIANMSLPGITMLENTLSGEEYVEKLKIGYVASCFSTLMFRAHKMGIPCFSFGTDELLLKLAPYQNSNRVPVVLARYCFFNFGDISEIRDQRSFVENVNKFKVNVSLVGDILNAVSLLIKPELNMVINNDVFTVLEQIGPYERGLLFSGCNLSKIKELGYKPCEIRQEGTGLISDSPKKQNSLDQEVKVLRQKLVQEKERSDRLKRSLSWRITAPIRFLGRVLK